VQESSYQMKLGGLDKIRLSMLSSEGDPLMAWLVPGLGWSTYLGLIVSKGARHASPLPTIR
jgi:hypothetical protein